MITPDMSYGKTINDGVKEYQEVLSSTGQVVGYKEIKKEEPKVSSSTNNTDGGSVFFVLLLLVLSFGGLWFVFFK